MPITLTTNTRNIATNSIVDLIDTGTTNPTGSINIYTSGLTILLVTLNFSNPAYGNSLNGRATGNPVANGVALASGTASIFTVVNRNGVEIFRGTVSGTGGGGDIELSSILIATSQIISISSSTFTMPST